MLGVIGHLAHPVLAVEPGQHVLDGVSAGEHVGDARGDAQVVLQNGEPLVGADDVGPAHGDVDVVGDFQAAHLHAVLRTAQHEVDGHDPLAQAPALAVNVFQEQVERGEALLEAAFDVVPLRPRQQPGHAVDGDDPFGGFLRVEHREGDALVQKAAVDALLEFFQILGREFSERGFQPPARIVRSALRVEHLVIKTRIQIVSREWPPALVLSERLRPHVHARLHTLPSREQGNPVSASVQVFAVVRIERASSHPLSLERGVEKVP